MKYWRLNLLEPSGTVPACNGIALPFITMVTNIVVAMVTTVTDVSVVSFAAMVTNGTHFHRLLCLPERAESVSV